MGTYSLLHSVVFCGGMPLGCVGFWGSLYVGASVLCQDIRFQIISMILAGGKLLHCVHIAHANAGILTQDYLSSF